MEEKKLSDEEVIDLVSKNLNNKFFLYSFNL